MPALSSTAPAKIILFGEHAVVYGRPAIAAPVRQLSVKAVIRPNPTATGGRIRIQSPSIGLDALLDELPEGHPIRAIVRDTLKHLDIDSMPACSIRVTSTIPAATGLGSGAAVSVALARGISAFLGRPLPDKDISRLAFGVETIHHGTPSGIDNSVIAYNRPIYFIKDQPLDFLQIKKPLRIVIADTGIPSPTRKTVDLVRRRWRKDPEGYNTLFEEVAGITKAARKAMERGEISALGRLMDENQSLLERMGVSSPELNQLIGAAREAGGIGAKLSGGGGGGNMIALVDPPGQKAVVQALKSAGAAQVIPVSID